MLYLTYQEVADRLGVHRKTVAAWAARGDLPVVRMGHRTTRVSTDDLDRFMAARTRARVAPRQAGGGDAA